MPVKNKNMEFTQEKNLVSHADHHKDISVAEQLRYRWAAIRPKVGVLLIPVALAVVVLVSPETGKLFLRELVLSSFILMALLFMKAGSIKDK